MNHNRLESVIEQACSALRGSYAQSVVRGEQRWSGMDLKGKARRYGGRYYQQRIKAGSALFDAGGLIAPTERGLLLTAVPAGMDDYGNRLVCTLSGVAVAHRAGYRHL